MKTYEVATKTIELFVKCMLMTFSKNDEKLHGEVSMRSTKMKVAFDGTLLKGKAHGEGLFKVSKKAFSETVLISKHESCLYNGEFKDGKPDGKGKMFLLNGDYYDGQFKNGLPHGEGSYTWVVGETETKFFGNFEDGRIKDGEGELLSDVIEYVGAFKDGKCHGDGILSILDGSEETVYEGCWKNNQLIYGRAKYYTDGKCNIYEGGFTSGVRSYKRHGKATYNFANGDYCVCEFVNDMQMGYAEMTHVNGEIYKGQMKNFEREGCGKIEFTVFDSKGIKRHAVFEGKFRGNKHDGKGKMIYGDGGVYEGDMKCGERHGKGKMIHADGCVYEGYFENNEMNGKGKVTLPDGQMYIGDWKDDIQHGKGKLTLANGDVYEGNFKDGAYHGQAKLTYANGAVYEGEWKDGSKHGKGKYTFADGDVYEGDYKDGERHGKGKYTFASGNVYEGDLKNNEIHGKGKITYVSGNVYEGDWKDGKKHGKGKETYANGDVYEGDWKNGNEHGKGKKTYADGTVYEGEWKDGKWQGKGKLTYADGNVYECDFKDGAYGCKMRKYGQGEWHVVAGDTYEGDYKDGRKHGKGEWTDADGTIYEGEWRNGKKHGKAKETYANGDVYEGDFRHNTRQGRGVLTFRDSKLYDNVKERVVKIERIFIADGKWSMNGPVTLHLANGESKCGKLKGGLFYMNEELQEEHKIEEEEKDKTVEKMLKLQAEWAARKRQEIAKKGIMGGVQSALDEKLKLQVAYAECSRCRELKKCTSKSCKTRKFREAFYKCDTHHCQKPEKKDAAVKEVVEDADEAYFSTVRTEWCKENVAAANAANAFTFGLW